MPAHNEAAGWKIWPGDDLDQGFGGNFRVFHIGFAGSNNLGRVMRRDIGRHTHSDTIRAIDQQIRVFSRQYRWFQLCFIIVLSEFNCIFVDITQQTLGGTGQTRLGIAHRRCRIAVNRAEIALPINQRQPHREILCHAHHGFVDRAVAMRVVITHHITDDTGGFTRRL